MLTSLLSMVLRLVIARALFKVVRDDDEAYVNANQQKPKAAISAKVVEEERKN
jgi:hypothetical protein